MPRPRSTMRRIREVLRLRLGEGLSGRQVSAATGIALTTAWDYVDRARRADLQWPLPEEMDDDQLELRLFGLPLAVKTSSPPRPLPDWSYIHKEIRRKGVTPAQPRIPGPASRRVSVLPVLRPVPAVAEEARPHHAPRAPRRREDVSRLRRAVHPGDRRQDRSRD